MGKELNIENLSEGVTDSLSDRHLEELFASGLAGKTVNVAVDRDTGPSKKFRIVEIGDVLFIDDTPITVTGIEDGNITLQTIENAALKSRFFLKPPLNEPVSPREFKGPPSTDESYASLKKLEHEEQFLEMLLSEHRAELDRLRSLVKEQSKNENDDPVLIDQTNDRLRITETDRGVVKRVSGDEVTVDYDVNDDIVEHLYLRSQFRDGRLPKEGDCLEVTVVVSSVDAKEKSSSPLEVYESRRSRTNLREVPDDF